MGSADYLHDMASDLLAAAEAALDPARTGNAVIDRTFVSHAEPAWDLCEHDQLTVHAVLGRHRQTSRQPCQVQPLIEWHVQVVRCVPTVDDSGTAPTADALDVSAETLLVDLWCLLTGLYDAARTGGLADDCGQVSFGDCTPLGPSGGIAGWDVVVEVACDDAGPPPAS